MTDGLLIFTYFIILLCGIVIGGAIVGAYALKKWIQNKLENLTVEIKD